MPSLRLSLLDELYLNLDRDDEPWTVHYELGLPVHLDAARLAGAIALAAGLHPLARARLGSWRFQDRGYEWMIADRLEAVAPDEAECRDDAELADERERFFRQSPSLTSAPPFRVLLAHRPDGDSLLLNLHHAAGDGVSAARLMLSIVRAYVSAEDPIPAVDPLAVHDVRKLSAARSLRERRARAQALLRGAWRPLVPTARVARDGGDGRPAYGFELAALTREESNALFARPSGDASVNDVLLAALAVAISRWNAGHGRRERWIALSMPVNLRPPAWRSEVVSNFASWATIWIRPEIGEDLYSVVRRIASRTWAIKQDNLGGIAVDLLEIPGRLMIATKRWLQYLKPLSGDVVVDTASLSNLGRLDALPSELGAPATSVWFSPPGQMPLGVSIGAATLDGRLHLTLRYRHAQFGAAAARRFMDLYRHVLLG